MKNLLDLHPEFLDNLFMESKYIESNIKDYINLLKPRVMSLVVFTSIVGMYLAPGYIHPFFSFITILCIASGSGAAGAINMWYERDSDKIMERTKNRPIPLGKIIPSDAIEFAVIIAGFSVFTVAIMINFVTAFLLLTAILFYVFIYTIWLKRRTPQNIVIGGAAGAFPPIIGWSAVTGSISYESIILFLIIFIWTPPHFWALSLYKSDDYLKANIPMLPIIKGHEYTRLQILIYSIILFTVSIAYGFFFNKSMLYILSSILLNMRFMYLAFKIYKTHNNLFAPKLFSYSIIYLFLLFFMLILDKFFI